MIIEGAISIKGAIEANKRIIEEVYIDKDKKDRNFNYIRKICKERNIKVNEINKDDFKSFEVGKTFGGIIASVSQRKEDTLKDGDIFVVDGVEDPFNLGYIARSLYALGVNNIILPKKDYSKMETQILKSSAAAFDFINIKYSDDLYKDVKTLKGKYTIYGLKRCDESSDIFEETFNNPCVFLLGGEKRGLSANLENLCDKYLYISYGNNYRNALNACSATAMVAALLYRQRKHDNISR